MGRFIEIVKQLRVEPFIFFHMFAITASQVTQSQLIQDKICVLEFNQTNDYCMNLNQLDMNSNQLDTQSKILVRLTQLNLYTTFINTFPVLIWSLFIGSWCDKYIHGRKILMCFAAIGSILDMILLMINAFSFNLSLV